MKQLFLSNRSKYLFALAVLSIGIGIISKKVISYPTECSPINNQELSYFYPKFN